MSCELPAPGREDALEAGDPSGERPLVVWDRDCGFCKRSALHLLELVAGRIAFEPYQTAAARHPEIPEERFRDAVHLIEPGGRVSRGAEALFRALALGGRRPWWWLAYRRLPGFAALAERSYGLVARNRGRAARLARLLAGDLIGPPRYRLTRWLFVRLLGLVFLVAFASLGVQIVDLVGERGLLPAEVYLRRVALGLGAERFWSVPTLMWLGGGDAALRALAWGGIACALALTLGVAQGPALLLCYAGYLSLFHVGQSFLAFQWDVLLLESAFLSLFIAPWRLRPRLPRDEGEPSLAGIWLLRLLLFKLMFASGVTKLTWHDRAWWDLTALGYHYWTQPLPTPVAWYAHQLPLWFQKLSCLVMYAIEIALPFLIFTPRRPRRIALWGLVSLQVAILVTGNYGFFNLLALALCATLLDDDQWPERLRRGLLGSAHAPAPASNRLVLLRFAAAAAIASLSIVPLTNAFNTPFWQERAERPFARLHRLARSFGACGEYGLFRVMTTTRPEIEVQGRRAGGEWRRYPFRYKPGDPSRAPPWVAPHMPRLDWLMWFAALHAEHLLPHGEAGVEHLRTRLHPWLGALGAQLLAGDAAARRLLAGDPFAGEAPDELRLVLWQYSFAEPGEPAWWRRQPIAELWRSSSGAGAPPRGSGLIP